MKIHLVSVRKSLKPRREPYWGQPPIAVGKYLGFRKINAESGTWIARLRDETGRQQYTSLGYVTPTFDYDEAKKAAEAWFKNREAGIGDEIKTVADACKFYIKQKRQEKKEHTAHDAEMRFKRTVYGTRFGDKALGKIRRRDLTDWRAGLEMKPASVNRTFTSVLAALNLAREHRCVSADQAQEWTGIAPFKTGDTRRSLYLDLDQRRALLNACEGKVRDLVQAAMLTGARAGELTNLERKDFDARTRSITFSGKTDTRTVPLSDDAVQLFTRLAKAKLPTAPLLTRDDGKPWAHSDWDELVREAATKAKLPRGVCLYTMRHSFITAAISAGMTTLDVARLVGTSLQMIEEHYGHLTEGARDRLAAVQML